MMVEKRSFSRVLFVILNTTFMIAFCVICIAPLLHVLMASISSPRELMANKGLLWKPLGDATLAGYKIVLKNSSILTGYINTLIYVVTTTVIAAVLTTIASYVLSRKDLKVILTRQ